MKHEQQSNREITTGSVLTAYGALSALLLLAAAIALFEAAVAIRKKLTQCMTKNEDDRHQLNNNEQSFDRKTTLSSCCLKYKKRDRIPVQKQHRRFSIQPQSLGSPQISITSSRESYDSSKIDSLKSMYETVYNPCEMSTNADDGNQWFPVSRLKHMGAPHFNNPSRRVSSPDWSGKAAWNGSRPSITSVETQFSLADRLARRSFAGQPALTVLPLTPGVARLSNSLLDCSDDQSETQLSKFTDACDGDSTSFAQSSPRMLLPNQRTDPFKSGNEVKSTIAPPFNRPELQRFSIQETSLIILRKT